MAEDLPKRRIPEFKIGKEEMENLKTIAAVTQVLSQDKDLAREIADIFKEVAIAKERELMERVSGLLAERVKDPSVSIDQIKTAFNFWYLCYLPPEALGYVWQTGWRIAAPPPSHVWRGWY